MKQMTWDIPEIIHKIKRLFRKTGIYDVEWTDVYPSAISTRTNGNNVPAFTAYNGNLYAYEFVGTGSQLKEIQIFWQLPHEYQQGSTINPHIHLRIPNDGTGGVIEFFAEYSWCNIDSIEVSPLTTNGLVTIPANAGNLANKILDLGPITGTGKTISSIFSMRLWRDPTNVADTFGASCWMKSAAIHIQQDKLGSDLELVKDA